jgi:hypothetical protein
MKTTIKIVVFVIIMLLCLSIGLQYYISHPIDTKEVLCHKGKLIHRIGDDGSVYLRVKGVSCVFEKGIIIIEEKS